MLSPHEPQDFVLEIGDCDAFVKANDTQEKGAISREDFATVLAPDGGLDSITTKSITSKRSDDPLTATMRE